MIFLIYSIMANLPLTNQEIDRLTEFLSSLGWSASTNMRDKFRFAVEPNKFVSLTVKKGIELPISLQVPFELVSFQFSLLFKLRFADEHAFNLVNFLATNLRNIGMKSQIDHQVQMEGVEGKFLDLCDEMLPGGPPSDTERAYLNKIRIRFLDRVRDLIDIDRNVNPPIVRALEKNNLLPSGLHPAFGGKLPEYRHDITLNFSNLSEQDDPLEEGEYFTLEPGYATYIRDKVVNYIHVRAFFESYGFYFLHEVWKDVGIDLGSIISSWIHFSRMTLGSLLNLASHGTVDRRDLIDFSLKKYLEENYEVTAFPVSALFYETMLSKTRSQPDTGYLIRAATSFEEKEAVKKLNDLKEEVGQGATKNAIKPVMDILKVFGRHRQKRGALECLLLLSTIAERMNQLEQSRKYLTDALNVARDIPGENPSLLMDVQKRLAAVYLKQGDADHAFTYYESVLNRLQQAQVAFRKANGKKDPTIERERAMLHLELAKVHASRGDFTKS
ncbi:MAG: tetratricopeptide repeat protein, partial [Promethearchaeota archaeon]